MINLAPVAAADKAAAEDLYLAAFPPEERRPWQQIADTGTMPRLCGLYNNEELFVGFVTVWTFERYAYVEHFAVSPSQRGGGIGAAAMAALRQMLGMPVVLEVEPPTHRDPMAPRRIAFFERCGFALLDYDYVQPPYSAGLPSVPLCLMSTDPGLDPAEIERTLHSQVYGYSS